MKTDDELAPQQAGKQARRRKIPSRDARKAILDAAEILSVRRSFSVVTVDSVAKQAGLHKMAIYRTFGSREALIRACVERARAQRRVRWLAIVQLESEDPRERIVALFKELSRGIAYQTDGQFLAPDSLARCSDATRDKFMEYREDIRTLLKDLVGQLPVLDREGLVDALMLVWRGAVTELLSPAEERRVATLLPALVRQISRCFESDDECQHLPFANLTG
ncbi:TetR family transcriptional regulator [Paraburkholderia sp. BL6669N2]|uniref:TetR/AcrR family transcriptional regulator n=1 Tax=Paraburkholderia sp. BL6669N2 TaxID=1938807 RepID=UPI000E25F53A|nr:TetR/AcrR family transcriptional regulator [Paraburkholderia sp. BL6669N2]REG50955.1 TetR family transcriptional regulator [Paraburkholderia sp. BL6669N2]